jgi:4-hydroxy-tetrahydrodipicolinate synthase
MMREIFGNQALVVTPMTDDGAIDEASLRRMLDFVVGGGAHGVLVLGSTGEFFSLGREERERVIRIAAEQVSGRCALGVGTADTGSGLAAELARFAERQGADYVLIPPPYYAPLSMNTERGIYAFFREIAEAAPIRIMLYDGGSGIEIPIDVIRRLREETPNVCAIKVNVVKPAKVRAIQAAGLTAFCGMDAVTMPMMRYGADGFTLGVGNLLPSETSRLYDQCKAGNWDGAAATYYGSLLPVINATLAFLPEYVASFKLLLHWMGIIDSPAVRAPLVPLDEVRQAEIRASAKRVGLL